MGQIRNTLLQKWGGGGQEGPEGAKGGWAGGPRGCTAARLDAGHGAGASAPVGQKKDCI